MSTDKKTNALDRRNLRHTAVNLCTSFSGKPKGLESLQDYAKDIESITAADVISEWSIAVGIRLEDIEIEKEAKQKRKVINLTPEEKTIQSIYYDSWSGKYVRKNERGTYLSLNNKQISSRLKVDGLSSAKNQNGMSEVDEMVLKIEETNDVGYVGALAGYKPGVYMFGSTRALVIQGRNDMNDHIGEWPLMKQVFETLLLDGQIEYFYSWLYFSVIMLDRGTHAPGQALAIAGERGCGKSLCQQLVTQILGGRCARPYQYMVGETPFNADLFEAEHLMIEDEANSTDNKSRKKFGAYIKNVVANKDQRLHGKGKNAVMLHPLWRVTITCNDDAEALMVLPPMEDGLEDKLMLFKASFADLPMPAGTPDEKELFWRALMRELPHFMHFIRNEYAVPEEIEDPRYGVIHYHNKEMMDVLSKLSPEMHLLELIDAYIMGEKLSWHGTASDLLTEITDRDCDAAFEARKLLSWPNAAGTYLGRLAKRKPERVKCERTGSSRDWRIIAEINE